jgi:hypothetical protein
MPNKELTTVASETLEDGAIQVEVTLPVRPRRQESPKGGQSDGVSAAGSPARIPRITRLMALAIKFETMVGRGEVRDYADLARLGYVTRARLTQIMNLLLLAPQIQEEVLCMDGASIWNAEVSERDMRPLVYFEVWHEQKQLWDQIKAKKGQKVTAIPRFSPSGTRSVNLRKQKELEGSRDEHQIR